MKIKSIKLWTFLIGAFLFMNQTTAQQLEVEYDSSSDNPQIQVIETGAGASFSIIKMQNLQPGHWTLASRTGASSDFNVYYQNDVDPGKNYINIDATDDEINMNSEVVVNDGDVTISGVDPDLVISSDATGDPAILFGANGGSSDGRIWYDSDRDIMKFGTSTTTGAMNVNADGKIGFDIDRFSSTEEIDSKVTIRANSGNTSTPAHLELYENNNSGFPNIQFTNFSLDGFWEIQARSEGSPTSNGFMHFNHSSDGTTSEEIFTIDGSDERVGVMDATPEYTFSVDHASGSPNNATGSRNGFNIENTSNADSWTFYTSSTSGDLRIYYDATTGTGAVPILRGTFDSGNGVYASSSDLRLKKNISNLENQLEKVMKMRPTKYQFKAQEGEEYSLGLIAQELQEIVPEVVTEIANEEEAGVDYLGVAYSELVPVLIGAIQDQQAIIDAQKTELAEVKASMASMMDEMKAELTSMIKAELTSNTHTASNDEVQTEKASKE